MPYTPTTINPLQAWVQTVIPTVYDDSLSYLEFLGKVRAKLNELIASDAAQSAALAEFLAKFEGDLTATVTAYLDVWKADGTIQAILTASLDEFNNALGLFKAEVNADLSAMETSITTLETDLETQIALKQGKMYLSVKDYGATGDGITNDQIAIQAANDAAAALQQSIFFPPGIYLANALTMTCGWEMAKGATLKLAGANGSTFIACSGSYLKSNLYLDGDNKAPYAMLLISGQNNLFSEIVIKNINANDGLGLSNVKTGVYISGNNNLITSLYEENLVNGGHVNDSMPQGLAFVGTASENRVGNFSTKGVQCGIVTDNTTKRSFVNIANIIDAGDNGIYSLNGSLIIESFTYYGTDEAMVIGDQVKIGRANILKASNSAVSLNGIGAGSKLEIGSLYLGPEMSSAGTVIKTRSTNSVLGLLYIGRMEGVIKTATFCYMTDGAINQAVINNVNLEFQYDAAIATAITNWFQFNAIKGYAFKNWKVKIVDLNNVLTGSNEFHMGRTDALTYDSYFEDVEVIITNSDKLTVSAGLLRIFKLAEANVYTKGVRWQMNVGPYGRHATYGQPDTASAIPTLGTWRVGQVLYNRAPAAAGYIGWVCTSAGTPGTWKTFGAISA